MTPDDVLRDMESRVTLLRLIRTRCEFVGPRATAAAPNDARQCMLTRVRSRNHDCAEMKPFTVLLMARELRSWMM